MARSGARRRAQQEAPATANSIDFFAAIRAVYNHRSRDETFERLTFVLLGVAAPADLVEDQTRTPFNIGKRVELSDFDNEVVESDESAGSNVGTEAFSVTQ